MNVSRLLAPYMCSLLTPKNAQLVACKIPSMLYDSDGYMEH